MYSCIGQNTITNILIKSILKVFCIFIYFKEYLQIKFDKTLNELLIIIVIIIFIYFCQHWAKVKRSVYKFLYKKNQYNLLEIIFYASINNCIETFIYIICTYNIIHGYILFNQRICNVLFWLIWYYRSDLLK